MNLKMLSIKSMLTGICFILFFNVYAQFSETFNLIDKKNGFKDIVFGSSFSEVSKKMGIVKKENKPNEYTITQIKYLSVGIYKILNAFTEFNEGRLSLIAFEIPHDYKEVIDYFTKMFGKPKFTNMWLWEGKNITYAVGADINTNHALIAINSNKIPIDDGENNF